MNDHELHVWTTRMTFVLAKSRQQQPLWTPRANQHVPSAEADADFCPGPTRAFKHPSVSHSRTTMHGGFVWVHRALNRQKRRFSARAVAATGLSAEEVLTEIPDVETVCSRPPNSVYSVYPAQNMARAPDNILGRPNRTRRSAAGARTSLLPPVCRPSTTRAGHVPHRAAHAHFASTARSCSQLPQLVQRRLRATHRRAGERTPRASPRQSSAGNPPDTVATAGNHCRQPAAPGWHPSALRHARPVNGSGEWSRRRPSPPRCSNATRRARVDEGRAVILPHPILFYTDDPYTI